MGIRITQRSVALTSLQGLNRNLSQVAKLQQQMTSGKLISSPSDSPTGTNKAMLTRQDSAAALQQARNISDGVGRLDATDSALQNMITQVRRVRDLTVQAANTGALSDTAKQAIRTELLGIRDSLLGQANTVVQNRPLFGGVTSGNQAYDPATGAYIGVGGANGIPVQPVNRRISDSTVVRVDITGPESFGDPAGPDGDLFAQVQKIADDVVGPDPTLLQGDLTALDGTLKTMLTAAAEVGVRSARLEAATAVNSDRTLTLQSQLGDVENVDLPKTIMELQMQQTGYQAALGATAKAIQPSLLDFLK